TRPAPPPAKEVAESVGDAACGRHRVDSRVFVGDHADSPALGTIERSALAFRIAGHDQYRLGRLFFVAFAERAVLNRATRRSRGHKLVRATVATGGEQRPAPGDRIHARMRLLQIAFGRR